MTPPFTLQGKVALITGAGRGIGLAVAQKLADCGAAVMINDLDPEPLSQAHAVIEAEGGRVAQLSGDITAPDFPQKLVNQAISEFGGLDIIVSNAGIFPPSMELDVMDPAAWEKSMQLNLTSHQRLMKAAIPYLSHGIDPTIILIASKNVPAPGPGAAAYSVAKAGLTQLGRIAALELGSKGIRVNMLHPNQVFDTAIWTKEVLEKRAKQYGLSVEEYKTNNILHTTITSYDVANLVCAMAGPAFAKTTGAQIPIDGGNDRVI